MVLAIVLLIILGAVLWIAWRATNDINNSAPSYTSDELYTRATQQIESGDYVNAESYLEQALLKEDDSTYRGQLAVVKYRLRKYNEAIVEYQKLISLGKDEAFAWNGTGNAYRDQALVETERILELQEKALDSYQKSIQADSKYAAAYSNQALLQNEMGDRVGAVKTLDLGIAATNLQVLKDLKERL